MSKVKSIFKIKETKKKRDNISEAIKISVELDPKDIEGMHPEPEQEIKREDKSLINKRFENYVKDISCNSALYESLLETSRELGITINDIMEDLSILENKREFNAAEHMANEKIMRSWRVFLRELNDFQNRFGKV